MLSAEEVNIKSTRPNMRAHILNENFSINFNEGTFVDSSKLKFLVEKMRISIETDYCIDYSSTNRFSSLNKESYNPFGYDLKRRNRKRSFYRDNKLRHKLIRIHNEFKFVKKNIRLYQKLTLREKEIIQLLSKGFNNPEVAQRLYISRSTVEQHHKNINRKLKINSISQLLRFSYAFDLI